MINTVVPSSEKKDSKVTKQKVLINTLTPNFNYKNKKGEIVKTNTEVSF